VHLPSRRNKVTEFLKIFRFFVGALNFMTPQLEKALMLTISTLMLIDFTPHLPMAAEVALMIAKELHCANFN
jgi:hypothetical protein